MTARCLRRNKRWALTKFCFFLYVFIGVFTLVWLRTTVVNLGYELSELENQKTTLLREGKLFSAERANLYSASRIEEVAIKDLGMSFPKRDKIFFVKKTTGAIPYKASINLVRKDVSNGVKPVLTDIASEKNKLDMRGK
jgi:cell division protein FtsL